MSPDEMDRVYNLLSERDREKVDVILRSFATGEDLAAFIEMTQAVHKEQAHRAWAWGVVKKTAALIVLLGGAMGVIKAGLSPEWFTK
jgi:2-phosphoglycerate kinase